MRRLTVTVAMAVLGGAAACTTTSNQNRPPDAKRAGTGTCNTKIELHVTNGGGLSIPDPVKLVCAPEETINVTFVNHDPTRPHEFLISEIGCQGDKADGHDPTKGGLLGHPTNVPANSAAPMAGTPPKMGTNAEIKALQCGGTAPYLFGYTIKVPGVKDKDPDLEVSPPPPLQ